MTIQEMHNQFKVKYDKIDSNGYPNLLPEEIDLLLNSAQREFVKGRYTGSTTGKGFEENQKRTDDVRYYVAELILPPVPNTREPWMFNLPGNYWFELMQQVQVRYSDNCNKIKTIWKAVKAIQTDDFIAISDDPFNKPEPEYAVRLLRGNQIEVYIGEQGFVLNYRLRYIRIPEDINIVTMANEQHPLPDHTHDELVNIAVIKALEFVEQPRVSSFMQREIGYQE